MLQCRSIDQGACNRDPRERGYCKSDQCAGAGLRLVPAVAVQNAYADRCGQAQHSDDADERCCTLRGNHSVVTRVLSCCTGGTARHMNAFGPCFWRNVAPCDWISTSEIELQMPFVELAPATAVWIRHYLELGSTAGACFRLLPAGYFHVRGSDIAIRMSFLHQGCLELSCSFDNCSSCSALCLLVIWHIGSQVANWFLGCC